MKKLRIIATTLLTAGVFLAGGALLPLHTTKADPTTTPQDCPAGYHSVVTISPTQPTIYDCAVDDSTPQTAPANQTPPPAVAAPIATTPAPAAPNCH